MTLLAEQGDKGGLVSGFDNTGDLKTQFWSSRNKLYIYTEFTEQIQVKQFGAA